VEDIQWQWVGKPAHNNILPLWSTGVRVGAHSAWCPQPPHWGLRPLAPLPMGGGKLE